MVIKPKDAGDWIANSVVGGIKKTDLDHHRATEMNQQDMMQNTSILYNL